MECKKNWFSYFCITFTIVGLLYIFVGSISSLGQAQEYPYLPKGLLMIGIFVTWVCVIFFCKLLVRFRIGEYLCSNPKRICILETVLVLLVMIGATAVRVWIIENFPIKPTSDYKTYYEIAELLRSGTIQKDGKGYCEYIAMFPHVYGYCTILKIAFSIFGASARNGLYVNLVFSVLTVFVIYRIGRMCGGRIAGLVSMVICAFWPSQVLYCSILSAEPAFTFMIFGCLWFFLYLTMKVSGDERKQLSAAIGYMVLGVMIALTAAVRPMGLILLIAIALVLIPLRRPLPGKLLNDIPLMQRFMRHGWFRLILIIIPYLVISGIITTNIELTINKDVASGSASFGYNMLVGLNTQSDGGWNEEDKNLLYDTMAQTGSATLAHMACRDLAITRLTTNPVGIFNLFIHKYELLWGNDDYGSTWNIAFLNEQGNLTKWRSDFLYSMRDINNIYYAIVVFFAIIGLIFLYTGKGNYLIIPILLFLGTVAMHLLVESQNRYHFFALQVFMLLAGYGIQGLYQSALQAGAELRQEMDTQMKEEEHKDEQKKVYMTAEEEIIKMREQALENVFDMKSALENGNVIMTVSEAYKPKEDEVEKNK